MTISACISTEAEPFIPGAVRWRVAFFHGQRQKSVWWAVSPDAGLAFAQRVIRDRVYWRYP